MISQTCSVGHSTINITFDDIVKSGAEILVRSDDTCLSMGVEASDRILLVRQFQPGPNFWQPQE